MQRTTRPEAPATPIRYTPTAQEARELRRQIGRFRYWRQRAHGERVRCLDALIALVERQAGIERRTDGTTIASRS